MQPFYWSTNEHQARTVYRYQLDTCINCIFKMGFKKGSFLWQVILSIYLFWINSSLLIEFMSDFFSIFSRFLKRCRFYFFGFISRIFEFLMTSRIFRHFEFYDYPIFPNEGVLYSRLFVIIRIYSVKRSLGVIRCHLTYEKVDFGFRFGNIGGSKMKRSQTFPNRCQMWFSFAWFIPVFVI